MPSRAVVENTKLCRRRQELLRRRYQDKRVRDFHIVPARDQGSWNVPLGSDTLIIHFTDGSLLRIEVGAVSDEFEDTQEQLLVINRKEWPESFNWDSE